MRKIERFRFVFAQNRADFRSFSTIFTDCNREVAHSGETDPHDRKTPKIPVFSMRKKPSTPWRFHVKHNVNKMQAKIFAESSPIHVCFLECVVSETTFHARFSREKPGAIPSPRLRGEG
jgi:hypothetical protein